jgi:hypothetical protein
LTVDGSGRWVSLPPNPPYGVLPSIIYDLPFLKEQAKRNILGGNAARLFGLDTKVVKKTRCSPFVAIL